VGLVGGGDVGGDVGGGDVGGVVGGVVVGVVGSVDVGCVLGEDATDEGEVVGQEHCADCDDRASGGTGSGCALTKSSPADSGEASSLGPGPDTGVTYGDAAGPVPSCCFLPCPHRDATGAGSVANAGDPMLLNGDPAALAGVPPESGPPADALRP